MVRGNPREIRLLDILSTAFIYLVSVSTILVFAVQFLRTPKFQLSIPSIIVLILLMIIPFVLSTLAILAFSRLLYQKIKKHPGSRLKLKIAVSFAVLTAFACIPQAILLLISEYALVDTWFSSGFKESIDSGGRISILYWNDKRSQLLASAERDLKPAAQKFGADTSAILETLRSRNPDIFAIQAVIAGTGAQSFSGDALAELPPPSLMNMRDGILPSDTVGQNSFIRVVRRVSTPKIGECIFVLSISVNKTFTEGAMQISRSQENFDLMMAFRPQFKWIAFLFYIALAAPLLFIAVLAGISVSESLTTPIRELSQVADKVALGDLSVRVLNRTGDELADFAQNFNRMLSELQKSGEDALQSEKITVWQDIAQKLAHELKNPLTPIKLSAERVLRRFRNDPETVGEIVEPAMVAVIQEVDRLAAMLTDFRNFARLPEPQFDWTQLSSLIDETSASYRTSWPHVIFDIAGIDPGISLRIDRNHIRQVLANLYANAIDAMNARGTIRISADLVKKGDSGYCRMRISDTGPGIPPDLRGKIFTPYFTTKAKGTGLGLSIVEHIIIDHKGEIRFESEQGEGTTFIIDLPIEPEIRMEIGSREPS